ncbi:MAG TPA: metallophosphoesterase, partial [Longimicrobiales bacterium]
PRIERRRRGHDFLANYALALECAQRGEVDLVVHGGDVFDRPHVPASLAYQAYTPLVRIAERGVPVFIVPGNHERSVLPHGHVAAHPLVHVFDRPRSFGLQIRGRRVALAGFPYERRDVRARFPRLLHSTGWHREPADARVLCIHHCVEGATVGPGNFTFRSAADVIRCADLPPAFDVVLSGHIHRPQALTTDLRRRRLPSPVLYAGSIERTSIAEAGEEKGFMIVKLPGDEAGRRVRWEFRRLPARPMIVRQLAANARGPEDIEAALSALIKEVPDNAILRIHLCGELNPGHRHVLSAPNLRRLAPALMNVEIANWRRGEPGS